MNTTINISLPKSMLTEAKKIVKRKHYVSVSELIRTALREKLYEEQGLTVNGLTTEFEDLVLKSEDEPEVNDIVWETPEDVDKYFDNLRKEITKKRGKR